MNETLSRLTGLDGEDGRKAGFAFCYLFCVLGGYYVLKPTRDEIALLLGKEFIPDLFVWTMLVMLVANPIFSALLNRLGRVRFARAIYRFFALNLLGFVAVFKYLESAGLMVKTGEAEKVTGLAFGVGVVYYVWVSVYNLFATSVFWALMADMFDGETSKKAFGLVGAGGTLGAFLISLTISQIVELVGPTNLLFITIVTLELAVQAMLGLTEGMKEGPGDEKFEGVGTERAGPLSGIKDIVRSPFLLSICLYMFLYTFSSSFLYFQKQEIVDSALSDRTERVEFFNDVNLALNGLTLVVQVFLTGRLIAWIGLSASLALVPAITCVGFVLLAKLPTLTTLAVFEVTRSTANYAISRPSREILYTAVSRREKYLSKSFIDTFVYRGGDFVASRVFKKITAAAQGMAAIGLAAVPAAVAYLFVGVGLGRAHARRMKDVATGK